MPLVNPATPSDVRVTGTRPGGERDGQQHGQRDGDAQVARADGRHDPRTDDGAGDASGHRPAETRPVDVAPLAGEREDRQHHAQDEQRAGHELGRQQRHHRRGHEAETEPDDGLHHGAQDDGGGDRGEDPHGDVGHRASVPRGRRARGPDRRLEP
jgi:hypothetical protein